MNTRLKIVDISQKDYVYRKAISRSTLVIDKDAFNIIEKYLDDIYEISRKFIRISWLYIPLLHPVPINNVDIKIEFNNNILNIEVSGDTVYKTGIEMDVLFSNICAISYIYHILWKEKVKKYPHIVEIRILEKVKRGLERGIDTLHNYSTNNVSINVPLRFDTCFKVVESSCVGFLRLRKSTIERVLKGDVEKGDPISICKVSSVESCKRFIEVVNDYVPSVLSCLCNLDFNDCDVVVKLYAKFCNDCDVGCLIFGVLCGLESFLDVVKMYEKDFSGNYPDCYIHDVSILC